MKSWDDYKWEKPDTVEPGNYRCTIVNAEEKNSKSSGNPMIVIEIKVNGSNRKIMHYFPKNQHFNGNMSRFFDSFDIEDGDFELLRWYGAMGACKIKEDENGYPKVAYFINQHSAASLPPWDGILPERNTVSNFEVVDDEEPLPF